MLEWRLLVAWRVDGWHIDLVFSGSVQSAASKHGQTVKRSLARPLSRGPRPHAPRTVRELGDLPDASDAGRRPSPTHQCDPCGWRVGLPPANGPSSWLFSATRYSVGCGTWVAEKRAAVCRTVPRIGTRERAAAGSATSTPTSCADPQGGSPSPVCRDAALLRGRRPPSRRECAAPPAK